MASLLLSLFRRGIEQGRPICSRRYCGAEALEPRALLSGGALDPTFGAGGIIPSAFSVVAQSTANAVVLQPDGKVVVGGEFDDLQSSIGTPAASGFMLARFNADGSVDSSFKNSAPSSAVFTSINALVLQTDGKIVAAGYSDPLNAASRHIGVARFLADGALDPTFGNAGVVVDPIGQDDQSNAISLESDGDIVVCGTTTSSDNSSAMVVMRYLPSGMLDPNFGTDGVITESFGATDLQATAVAVDHQGGVLLGATVNG